jgi:hypothetical protein|tara:strand:- start:2317 stop:2625 length:309 start_codon:yes stop_codon:yes gene_type:complete
MIKYKKENVVDDIIGKSVNYIKSSGESRLEFVSDITDMLLTAKFGIDNIWDFKEDGTATLKKGAVEDYYILIEEDVQDLIDVHFPNIRTKEIYEMVEKKLNE